MMLSTGRGRTWQFFLWLRGNEIDGHINYKAVLYILTETVPKLIATNMQGSLQSLKHTLSFSKRICIEIVKVIAPLSVILRLHKHTNLRIKSAPTITTGQDRRLDLL